MSRLRPSAASVPLLLAAMMACGPARAAAQLDGERDARGGWRELFDPDRRMGLLYRRHGLAKLVQAMGNPDPELGEPSVSLLLDQALIRFERARRLIPRDPELAYYTAYALTRYERPAPDGSIEYRAEEAIDAWHRLRSLDPGFLSSRVAYELAMLHMRRHDFEQARAEYEAALVHAVPPPVELMDRAYLAAPSERRLGFLYAALDVANVHGNLAEAAMLTGDVRAAVDHYRAAIELSSGNTLDVLITRSLAQWGLAVALDRTGAHDEAVRAARRALEGDPIPADRPEFADLHHAHGAFAVLHLSFVFFEPRYEVHAYEALGHESLAHPEEGGLDIDELRRAIRGWRLFLAEGGTASRFAPIARQHLERLEREDPTVAGPHRR